MYMREDCIFCKIINKQTNAYVVYETKEVISFLDINPITRGHLLVVPKKHYERFVDIPQEDLTAIFKVIHILCGKVEKKLSDNYNIGMNQGEYAGQIIPHIHFHVIPRYPGETEKFPSRHKLNDTEAREIVKLLTED